LRGTTAELEKVAVFKLQSFSILAIKQNLDFAPEVEKSISFQTLEQTFAEFSCVSGGDVYSRL